MRKVSGFTIIELVVVITILGILAAVALPRFFDIQDEARRAAAQGVAGAVASGAAINYGAYLAQNSSIVAGSATAVNACTTAVLGRVLTGGIPDNILVTEPGAGGLAAAVGVGTTGLCFFRHTLAAVGDEVTATIIKVE